MAFVIDVQIRYPWDGGHARKSVFFACFARHHDCGRDRRIHMFSVLLLTGDRDLREVAARVLTAAGFATATAAHSGHALLACLGPRAFDVLVIEEQSREAREDTARRLLRHQPGMRIVHVGRKGERADLVRPFVADDLVAVVALAAVREPSASHR
jgi:CheY-like chemotaxis protein